MSDTTRVRSSFRKICADCGQDVTFLKRVRDPLGNLYCEACAARANSSGPMLVDAIRQSLSSQELPSMSPAPIPLSADADKTVVGTTATTPTAPDHRPRQNWGLWAGLIAACAAGIVLATAIIIYRDHGAGQRQQAQAPRLVDEKRNLPGEPPRPPTMAPPAVPMNLVATAVASNQIDLSWGDVYNGTAYRIERSADGMSNWAMKATVGANTVSFQNTGLQPATTWYYRVIAINSAGGESGPSNVASATTSALPPPQPPRAPADVAANTASSSQIGLSWTRVLNATAYRIESSPDGISNWAMKATVGAYPTTFQDTYLKSGVTRYYRLIAISSAGAESSPSNVVSATTSVPPLRQTLPAPTGITARALSSSQISVSWADVPNATSYRIERSPDGMSNWSTQTTLRAYITTFRDTSLDPGTTWYYRVITINSAGGSDPSDVASARTTSVTPTPPLLPLLRIESWQLQGWTPAARLPRDHPLSPFDQKCSIVLRRVFGKITHYAGVGSGAAAASRQDLAYIQYRGEVESAFRDRHLEGTALGSVTRTVKQRSYDVFSANGSFEGLAVATVIYVGLQDGVCVCYWYDGNPQRMDEFLAGLGTAKLVASPPERPPARSSRFGRPRDVDQ